MKLAGLDVFRRTKFLLRTGHWVNGQDHASFALPAVRRVLGRAGSEERLDAGVVKRVASSAAHGGKRTSAGADADAQDDRRTKLAERFDASPRRLTRRRKLQLAFRTYRPARYEGSADLIVSEKTARNLQDPAHPINRVVPTRRLTVFGATHAEAVAGSDSRNARLIQDIIDEVPPIADRKRSLTDGSAQP